MEYVVEIIENNNLGNGIAKIDDLVVFVKGAIAGEIVKIKIVENKKNYAIGETISFIKKSPSRIEPICPYYEKCGGCKFLHADSEVELKAKEDYVKRLFKDYKVNDIVPSLEYNYRNKVVFHVKNGELGFYREGSNDLVSVNKCYLVDDCINNCIDVLRGIDLSSITSIMLRCNESNELMIKVNGYIDNKDILGILHIEGLKSLYQNDVLVYGDSYLVFDINNVLYTVYPDSFFQVNVDGMKKIYDLNRKYVLSGSKLLDLYCGTGTIGIYLNDLYNEILGIEINKDSVKNARLNKKLNKIDNINFICSDASDVNEKFDTVVVDPPRSGLSKRVISKILDIGPHVLVYTSCNPNTLKRDIRLLEEDYLVEEITPVNMFFKTEHIECVCKLVKR